MMRQEQIPYGVQNFKRIRAEGLYYVDKTAFIAELERRADFLLFVRPRRFGKSLLCDTLRCYYDVLEKENFSRLFGDLAIGKNPTPNANRYVVLSLDFSCVRTHPGSTWEERFERYMSSRLNLLIDGHKEIFSFDKSVMDAFSQESAASKFEAVVEAVHAAGLGLYLIVDEYDNFTNEIAASSGKEPYREVTHGSGFYRGWFKQFKGRCDRIFMTGVSPVTMDDLTSGFNIATNISLHPSFHAMVGFTAEETRRIFDDFHGCRNFTGDVDEHLATVRRWYDSYCFAEEKVGEETLYNCDMVLYYLSELVSIGRPPRNLMDANIRSDWAKLNALLAIQRHAETYEGVLPLTEELGDSGEVTFALVDSFPFDRVYEEVNFKSLYYYYGIVTMARVHRGKLMFRVPNECVRRQIFDYLREQYAKRPNAIDISQFADLFEGFAWDGKWRELLAYLAEKYRDNGSPRDGLGGEARINGYIRAYLTMENGYMVKPEMAHPNGFSDYALFPDPLLPAGHRPEHSYLIELKHAKAEATEAEIAAKHAEALAQLRAYAADPAVAKLAAGTPVHYLVYEFRGRDLVRLEEVDPASDIEENL